MRRDEGNPGKRNPAEMHQVKVVCEESPSHGLIKFLGKLKGSTG